MREMNPESDHEVMVGVARGNLAGMSDLYNRKHGPLFRFFFRLTGRQATAEDLVHDVFLRMIRYRASYRVDSGFEAWMYRIARNAFTDRIGKHRLETPTEPGDFETIAGGRPSAFDNLSKRQEHALLYRALRQLPEDKRELIVLSRFQGLTCEQIGNIVGAEPNTVKVRLFRAVKEMGRIYMALEKEKAS